MQARREFPKELHASTDQLPKRSTKKWGEVCVPRNRILFEIGK